MRTINRNFWKSISDSEYIAGLKQGDNKVTEAFFYGLCNYMLNDIRFSLMQGGVDYDDLVGELFIYLSEANWRKLDTFAGLNGCTLCSWVTRVAWRYFFKQRDRLSGNGHVDINEWQTDEPIDNIDAEIAIDVNATFERMPNKRYVQVLQWMLAEGYDADEVATKLNTSVANVYNIKHRAIVQFVEVYSA